jgi:hypothetical protein
MTALSKLEGLWEKHGGKLEQLLEKHGDKVERAIDKGAGLADKQTKGQHRSKIDQGTNLLKGYVRNTGTRRRPLDGRTVDKP